MSIATEHLERILEAAKKIEALMNSLPPAANPSALSRVRALCIEMRGLDSYINEKTGKVETLADQYLSARKHAKHRNGSFGPRDEINHDLLNRIRQQVRQLQNGQ